MDPDPFVQLRRVPFPLATIVQGALEAGGIEVQVSEGLGRVYGVEAGPFSTRLLVRRSQLAEATALLEELEAGGEGD